MNSNVGIQAEMARFKAEREGMTPNESADNVLKVKKAFEPINIKELEQ